MFNPYDQMPTFLERWIAEIGLGWFVILLIVAWLAFEMTVFIMEHGRGPFAIPALVLMIPSPFLLAAYRACDVVIISLNYIGDHSMTTNEMSYAAEIAVVHLQYGLLLMVPSMVWVGTVAGLRSFSHSRGSFIARVLPRWALESPAA